MVKHLIVCRRCGKQVERSLPPSKGVPRYCSPECKATPLQSLTCPTCGEHFKQKIPPAKANRTHYCSRQCADYAMRITGRERPCPQCGTKFETWVYRPTMYCSQVCQGKAHSKPENQVTVYCKTCSKPYIVHKSFVEKRNTKYCSRECMGAGMSILKRGENNPNYRGGSISYRGPNWRRQSRRARKRDGYTCQICGKKPKGRRCHVHHIKPYREFNDDWQSANDLSNLITLCDSCHSSVEFGELPCPQLLFP